MYNLKIRNVAILETLALVVSIIFFVLNYKLIACIPALVTCMAIGMTYLVYGTNNTGFKHQRNSKDMRDLIFWMLFFTIYFAIIVFFRVSMGIGSDVVVIVTAIVSYFMTLTIFSSLFLEKDN